MKMYAVKRMGKANTIGTSWYFTGVPGFDSEKCAIKCNKAEREFLMKIDFDVVAGTEEWGSMWVNRAKIEELKSDLEELNEDKLNDKELKTRESMTKFMQVCLDQGYEIRFY